MENYVFGDYVITRVQNAFNNKHSFWISKKDYMISFYCFSIDSFISEYNEELEYQLNNIDSYIKMFESGINK